MRLIAYTRVSTQEQDSTVSQAAAIRRYCEGLGHELVDVYSDKGSGAGMKKRTQLLEMLDRLRADDEIDGVIVTKIDRLSRSIKDWMTLIEDYFQGDGGKKLVAMDMHIDTSTAAGELFLTIMMALSQWERRQISERIKERLSEMRDKGMRLGGRIPYGWMMGGNKKKLKPNPNERVRVYAMQQLRDEGLGYYRVASRLNKMGYMGRHGRTWKHATIASILKSNHSRGIVRPPEFNCHDLEPFTRKKNRIAVKRYLLEAFDNGMLEEWMDEDISYEESLEDGLKSVACGTGHVSELEMEHEDLVALWDFPERDFGKWKTLTGGHGCVDYQDYQKVINQMSFDYRELGFRVVRMDTRVKHLLKEVKRLALTNNSENRAAVLSLLAAKQVQVEAA